MGQLYRHGYLGYINHAWPAVCVPASHRALDLAPACDRSLTSRTSSDLSRAALYSATPVITTLASTMSTAMCP
jgi:hypothetical protein